jgi:hypothetical protein
MQKIVKMCLLTHYVPLLFSKQWTSTINHAHHFTNFQMIQITSLHFTIILKKNVG